MDAPASIPVSQQRHTFTKAERLCSHSRIGRLFAEGRSRASFPVKAIWLPASVPGPFPVQIAFAVPKSRFRRAVQRNRIKRQLREVWRHAKPEFYAALEREHLDLVLLYQGKRLPTYEELTTSLAQILPEIAAETAEKREAAAAKRPPESSESGEADDSRYP
jgi:ribonuclease P protein component